jgi:hypothetical protein
LFITPASTLLWQGKGEAKMLAKEKEPAPEAGMAQTRIGVARDWGRLIRDVLIAALVAICILNPPVVRGWLGELGVSKVSLFGIELTPQHEGGIAAAVDRITQERDVARFERSVLVRVNRRAIAEFERAKAQMTPEQRAAVETVLVDIRRETGADPIERAPTPDIQQRLITGARREAPATTNWGVVFGGDTTRALVENLGRAGGALFANAQIVQRHNSYRSILLADSLTGAEQLLASARQYNPNAYVVNLDSWCPGRVPGDGYQVCGRGPAR